MSYDPTQEPTQPEESSQPATDAGTDDASFEFDPAFVASNKGPANKGPFVLGALLVVLAGVIWFMFFRGSPPAANAAGAGGPQANDQIKQFLDKSNINMMKQTLKETQKIVQQFQSYNPEKTQVPLTLLHSNPFRELPPKTDEGPVVQDDTKELEFHRQAQNAVADLHIQTIIYGKKHGCMINNTFYTEGQKVGMLKIEEIKPSSVIVSAGRYRFEKPMDK